MSCETLSGFEPRGLPHAALAAPAYTRHTLGEFAKELRPRIATPEHLRSLCALLRAAKTTKPQHSSQATPSSG